MKPLGVAAVFLAGLAAGYCVRKAAGGPDASLLPQTATADSFSAYLAWRAGAAGTYAANSARMAGGGGSAPGRAGSIGGGAGGHAGGGGGGAAGPPSTGSGETTVTFVGYGDDSMMGGSPVAGRAAPQPDAPDPDPEVKP